MTKTENLYKIVHEGVFALSYPVFNYLKFINTPSKALYAQFYSINIIFQYDLYALIQPIHVPLLLVRF